MLQATLDILLLWNVYSYGDSATLDNFMKNNPNAKVDDVITATGIKKDKVIKYFKKKGLKI